MEALFEPLAFRDITTSITDDSDAFLSFSSLNNFESIDSLFGVEQFPDLPGHFAPISSPTKTAPESLSSFDSASPSPRDIHARFFGSDMDLMPLGEVGIFHTPSKAGPSKLGRPGQIIEASYGSTYEAPVWTDHSTPGMTNRIASDSFGSSSSTSTNPSHDHYASGHAASGRSPYDWDTHALSASASSSPYVPHTPTPLRVTSNPSLRSDPPFHTIKQVKSMPALQEEPVQVYSFSVQDAPPLVGDPSWRSPPSTAGGYSTGLQSESSLQYPQDGYTDAAASLSNESSLAPGDPASWELTVEDVNRILAQEFPLPELTFSADYPPVEEEEVRPSSAPGLQMSSLHPGGLLNVPAAGAMTRSLSANGFVPHRASTAGSLFNFAPQQFPSGQQGSVQPLFTHAPQMYAQPQAASRAVSSPVSGWEPLKTVNPSSISPGAPLAHLPLNVQIGPTGSTYSDEEIVPAGLLAPPAQIQKWDHPQPPSAAMEMMRVASNPLPRPQSPGVGAGPVPAPALAPVSYYPVAETVPVAPVLLERPIRSAPHTPHTPIRGAAHPSNPFTTAPISYAPPKSDIFTSTPLSTVVHPPPASYTYGTRPITPTRIVHPPPYSASPAASSSRPVARLPSRTQRSPTSPSTPKRKGRQASAASGGFEMSFINYTSKDAQKLLTGVAPSGSQGKRKREDTAAPVASGGGAESASDRGRDKRSRSVSDEED